MKSGRAKGWGSLKRGSGELTLDELVEGARKERSFLGWMDMFQIYATQDASLAAMKV